MPEYIEREATLKEAESRIMWGASATAVYEAIQEAPAADVAPVVHGEWLDIHEGKTLRCPHCYAWVKADCVEGKSDAPSYCPNCGAKMDGGAGADENTHTSL